MNEYLLSTETIDWRHPSVVQQAQRLSAGSPVETARRAFEFVRDEVQHSGDCQLNPVTWRASDVLAHRTGFCYAKSHLLAALWRACGLPAGFCYQRLCVADGDGAPPRFALHGLAAVWLETSGWYRADPRGNRAGIDAQFTPPAERLAFSIAKPGEADLPGIWPEPLPQVVAALKHHTTYEEFVNHLPDVDPNEMVAGSGAGTSGKVAAIRVVLPYHLRMLAQIAGELRLDVRGPVTQRSVLDALEARFPVLRGTIRDHATQRRRAFLRLYACEQDLSNESPDAPLPAAVAAGTEPYLIISGIAGG